MGSKVNGINQIGSAECHPEKAGVGGSIPSLATTSFQRLSAISVPPECPTGVHLESKLGFHSAIASRLLAPLAPIAWVGDLPRLFQPVITEDFSTSANSFGVR